MSHTTEFEDAYASAEFAEDHSSDNYSMALVLGEDFDLTEDHTDD